MVREFNLRFSSSETVKPEIVLYLKKRLNRLGYYQPSITTGITPLPNEALVNSIKRFQLDYKLPATGVIRDGDKTALLLDKESKIIETGFYIWRTVDDEKVRPLHAAYRNNIRAWSDSPDPSEDYNCRCWAERIEPPVISNRQDREDSILKNTPAIFEVSINSDVDGSSPLYENKLLAKLALIRFDQDIKVLSQKHNVESDLVKAIIWSEHARGAYWGFGYVADAVRQSNTLMPMNINNKIWGSLIDDDLYAYDKNIEAGIILLRRVKDRIKDPTIAKIAAVWHYIGHEKTNDYAHYIERIYKEKPWKK